LYRTHTHEGEETRRRPKQERRGGVRKSRFEGRSGKGGERKNKKREREREKWKVRYEHKNKK
jgi:hypothetical protein